MNRSRIAWITNSGLVVAGIAMTSLGPALPFLIREYTLSLTVAGTLFGAFAGGRVSGVVMSNFVAERIPRKLLLTVGQAAFAVGLLGFSLSRGWWQHLILIAFAGLGYGLTDVVANAVVSDVFPKRRAFALNRLYAFYGVGCLIGPSIAAGVLGIGGSWRWIFVLNGMVAATVTWATARTIFPASPGEVTGEPGNGETAWPAGRTAPDPAPEPSSKQPAVSPLRFFASPAMIICGLAVGVYTGVGNGVVGWINTYFEEVLAAPAVVATVALFSYNGGITVGRFLASAYADRLGHRRTVILNAFAAAAALLLAASANAPAVGALAYALAGLFLAGISPTAMAIATTRRPDRAGAVAARIFLFGAGGSLLIPFTMGAVSDLFGLVIGVGFVSVLVGALVVAGAFLPRPAQRRGQ